MDGIIDKESNPFIKDSWIEQGYSFTKDRQELTPILFKRNIKEIKSLKEENYCSYPAFLAIRWGFAFLRNNILLQKPVALTTFGQSDCINNIYLEIKDLTPAMDGQYFPAECGQFVWFF